MIFLIGLRFLIVYFQVIGDLAMTGFGLVISGVVILLSVWGYNKYKLLIEEKIEEKIGGILNEK